jgi:transketolase
MSLVKSMVLAKDLYGNVKQVPTRDGYGDGLVEAAKKDARVVALCADLTDSTRTNKFKEAFPDRFIEAGVAEQALVTIGSGMANYGKIPFVSSYAAFCPGRCWEQIRTTVALNNVPVKVMGMHAGISVGPDGATHQALEDIATMRSMPNMIVIAPADYHEAFKATVEAARNNKPTYIRFGREKVPVVTTEKTPFKIGRAEVYREGKDVTVIACGPLVYEAMVAAKELEKNVDVEVISCHTVKPLDEKTILKSVKKTGAVITAEEAQIHGGLGGAVAELLGKRQPVPMEMIAVNDRYGESGPPDVLMKAFGLKAENVKEAIRKVMKRK